MRRPNLLIVEDNEQQRKLYSLICERFEFNCTLLTSCCEVSRLLEQDGVGFDMVLLDWSLKAESGLDCIKTIRQKTAHHRAYLPVIVVTAHAMTGDRQICLDAGADDYLAKPFNLSDFSDMVWRWAHPEKPEFRLLLTQRPEMECEEAGEHPGRQQAS